MPRVLPSHADTRDESGITLVELLVSVVILSMITGALGMAFVTGIKAWGPTSSRVLESNDAQVIASYLVRDAQSAGGTNVQTLKREGNLGVFSNASSCTGPAGDVVVQFAWQDRPSTDRIVANYFLDSATDELVRKTCVGTDDRGALPLATHVESVSVQCITGADPPTACPTSPSTALLPDVVLMTVTQTTDPSNPAFTYTLTASLRPEDQAAPTAATDTTAALFALGDCFRCPHGAAPQSPEAAARPLPVHGCAGRSVHQRH